MPPAQPEFQEIPLGMSQKNDIKLLRINYLRGPKHWTYRSVLEVWLDLGELEDFPSNKLPGFNERFIALLPALEEHHCGVGGAGLYPAFAGRHWAGHILEHVVIELLNLSGMPTGFGQTRSTRSTAFTAWFPRPRRAGGRVPWPRPCLA